MGIQAKMRREMIRYIVSRKITCNMTGEVLDMDRDIVILDKHGDPVDVVHHTARETLDRPEVQNALETAEWSIMER